jgi:MFS transporter, PPP family, 3-phenylpropionic acid transporter
MMPLRPSDGFSLRLAIFYACQFAIAGIQMPFFPLWLDARGLSVEEIGLVLAAPILVRIFAIPLLSRAADRAGELRTGLIAASFASALGFAIVGFAHGFVAIMFAVAMAALVSGPIMSLADAYALKGLHARGRAYGPVRMWGSAAFIAANLGSGLLLVVIAADRLIWLIAVLFALQGAAALWLRRLEPAGAVPAKRGLEGEHLWRSSRLLAVALAASLIQASHAMYYGFSAVDWTAKGIGSTTVGMLWAIGVMIEIALFALSGRLRIGPGMLLAIGATAGAIRWLAMTLDPPLALLVPIQCLHGLSFGATHLGAIQFISRAAGERRTAAAQGDLSTLMAIASAAATGVSGLLYTSLGDQGYAVMAAMAVLGGVCLIPVLRQR